MKSLRVWVSLFLFLLCFSIPALAQDTGSITGTVRDSSGAVIPGAEVSVSNTAMGLNRKTTTNSEGDYLVAGLPAGNYDLSISAKGFKEFQAHGFILRVAQKARVDATLTVGEATTRVVVEGTSVAQVETQSSELAGTVTAQELSQLQLNGRNFTQLATLVPGVSNQTGQDEGTVGVYGNVNFSFNGGRWEYNNWELDGGDNMDNGSNSTLNVYPSIDAIAEVRVLTSNYSAQYGRNGSGTVEVETKSGMQRFHGDVYEFVRNDIFNARNFFDTSRPAYKKNDFGYTFGGPFFIPGHYNTNKDKTFFFWSQEWRLERTPGPSFNVAVPSTDERSGKFSDLCPGADCPIDPATGMRFPGDQVPVDTANAVPILALIPPPNGTGCGGIGCFTATPSQPTYWREELVRVDHNINPKLRAMFRYIHDSWNTVTPVTLWGNVTSVFPTVQTNFVGPGTSMVARLTATASPTLLNEFVFSYTADHIFLTNSGPGAVQRPASMTMTGLFNNSFGGKLPGINLVGNAAYNGGFAEDPAYIPWNNANPTYTFRDNVSKLAGNHNLQFGFYVVAAQKNELDSNIGSITGDVQGLLNFNASNSAVGTGNAFADLLLGRIASYQQDNLQIKYYNRYKILEPYFQDDWHITPRLTLNLGLRVSLFGTYRERYKRAFNWEAPVYNPATAPTIDPNTGALTGGNPFDGIVQCGASGEPPGCVKGHLFNPAPRIGFAWDPWGDGKTAIRGGYGIFFEHGNGNEANTESLEGSPPLVQSPSQSNIVGYTNIGGTGLLFPLNVVSIPARAIWPYVQQWNLNVQRQLPEHLVASVAYVGSKGTHLNLQRNLNQLPSLPLALTPYLPGQPISSNDCSSMTVNGTPVTGEVANNLNIACGNVSPDTLRRFVGFSKITSLENVANSSYHSLQASLRRTVGPLILNLNYTYSHSIDNNSDRFDTTFVDSFNLKMSRASSNFDERHMLNIGYVYDSPLFRSPGLAHTLLGGWQLSGITSILTGTPFSVTNSVFSDNAGVANGLGVGSYPDLVGNPNAAPLVSNVPGVTGPLLYNPAAFVAPRGLTFGNSGRNRLNNPRRTNFDMALFKKFEIRESTRFEFRTEAFNIFNHTQFFAYNTATGSGNNTISCYAGSNNSAGDPSCVANSSFLHPSGAHRARTLQFGLKFIF